jgi:hypothetical protein
MTTQTPHGTAAALRDVRAQASCGSLAGRILPRVAAPAYCSDLLDEFLGAMDRIESETRDGFTRRCGLATSATVWR